MGQVSPVIGWLLRPGGGDGGDIKVEARGQVRGSNTHPLN